MKFTKEQLIEFWEQASIAAEVTWPAQKHLDLLDQTIKMMAVVEAARCYREPDTGIRVVSFSEDFVTKLANLIEEKLEKE